MKYLIAILLFVLPTGWIRILMPQRIKIKRGSRIGFSIILSENVIINENVRIGHLNFICVDSLIMHNGVSIGSLNYIKGHFMLTMNTNASIHNQNKITSPTFNIHKSKFIMEESSRLGVGHIFDLTSDVSIGIGTTFAGVGSQVWTHSFYFNPNSKERCRVDKPIIIGNYCNIGSRCIICPGVKITSGVCIGAGAVVSNSISEHGLYVSQKLRKIETYTPETIIESAKESPTILDDYHILHINM